MAKVAGSCPIVNTAFPVVTTAPAISAPDPTGTTESPGEMAWSITLTERGGVTGPRFGIPESGLSDETPKTANAASWPPTLNPHGEFEEMTTSSVFVNEPDETTTEIVAPFADPLTDPPVLGADAAATTLRKPPPPPPSRGSREAVPSTVGERDAGPPESEQHAKHRANQGTAQESSCPLRIDHTLRSAVTRHDCMPRFSFARSPRGKAQLKVFKG